MTRTTLIVCLWSGVAVCLVAQSSGLRPLENQQHFDESNCSFSLSGTGKSESDVLQWNFSDEAWINVGGGDVRLHRISDRDFPKRKGSASLGDRRVLRLSGDEVTVTLDTRTTKMCDPNDEQCEVWSEEGTLKARYRGHTATYRVKGFCGS